MAVGEPRKWLGKCPYWVFAAPALLGSAPCVGRWLGLPVVAEGLLEPTIVPSRAAPYPPCTLCCAMGLGCVNPFSLTWPEL